MIAFFYLSAQKFEIHCPLKSSKFKTPEYRFNYNIYIFQVLENTVSRIQDVNNYVDNWIPLSVYSVQLE